MLRNHKINIYFQMRPYHLYRILPPIYKHQTLRQPLRWNHISRGSFHHSFKLRDLNYSESKQNILRKKPLFQDVEAILTLFRGLDGYNFTKVKSPGLKSSHESSYLIPDASKQFWLLYSE